MEKRWYVLAEGHVSGPFSQESLEERISEAAMASSLIWGRGQKDWVSPEKWLHLLQEPTPLSGNNTQHRLWKLLIDGKELAPMSYDDMIKLLKGKSDLSNIQLWTEGYSEWRDIYQIHKIVDELGVSRRSHPRVPLMGSLLCEGSSGEFTARLLSVSEGGLGATASIPLRIGERLKILMSSQHFPVQIQATAEVVYVDSSGYFGLKFLAIQVEYHSLIVEYIKKFLVSNPNLG